LLKVPDETVTGVVLVCAAYVDRLITPTLNAPDVGAMEGFPIAFSEVKNINRQMISMSGGIERVERVLSSCSRKWRARSAELISCKLGWWR
jgi:hypothetical protein